MKIRLMTIDDYDQVVLVWKTAGLLLDEYDDSKAKIAEILLRNPESCLVGEVDNQIVAGVLGASDGKRAWVYHLGVQPKFQRQGIGTALVIRLIDYFGNKGIKKVNLMVLKHKSYLLPFYQKLGFTDKSHVITLERNLTNNE